MSKFTYIPKELKDCPNWVLHNKKKIPLQTSINPYNPESLLRAKSNTPDSWASFQTVKKTLSGLTEIDDKSKLGVTGIGYMFNYNMDDTYCYTGIDLDDCMQKDKKTKLLRLVPYAAEIVKTFLDCAYIERSPSGRGVHIILKCKKSDIPIISSKAKYHYFDPSLKNGISTLKKIEIYNHKRYFTVSARAITKDVSSLPDATKTFKEFLNLVVLSASHNSDGPLPDELTDIPQISPPLKKADVLELVQSHQSQKWYALYEDGDFSGYEKPDGSPDFSAAAHAIVCMLLFYTQDAGIINKIFKGGYLYKNGDKTGWKAKWDRLWQDEIIISYNFLASKKRATDENGKELGRFYLEKMPVATGQDGSDLFYDYTEPHNAAKDYFKQHPYTIFYSENYYEYDFSLSTWKKVDVKTKHSELQNFIQEKHGGYLSVRVAEDFRKACYSIARSISAKNKYSLDKWINGRTDHVIALQNGLFNLETGTIEEHSPNWFSLTKLPFTYDPEKFEGVDLSKTRFYRFLQEVFQAATDSEGATDSIDCLQRACGYVLSNDTSRQKIFYFYGKSRSGKGTLGRLIRSLVGEDNTLEADMQDIGSRFGIASLPGKKLLYIPEVQDGSKIGSERALGRLKSISGEDSIQIEEKGIATYQVKPTCKVLLCANKFPTMSDSKGALANRLLMFYFGKSFRGDAADPNLEKELSKELDIFFLWAYEGYLKYKKDGLKYPKQSKEVLEEFQETTNSPYGFVKMCFSKVTDEDLTEKELEKIYNPVNLEIETLLLKSKFKHGPRFRFRTSTVYEAYVEYCAYEGRQPMSMCKALTEIANILEEEFSVQKRKVKKCYEMTAKESFRAYCGIKLNEEHELFQDSEQVNNPFLVLRRKRKW